MISKEPAVFNLAYVACVRSTVKLTAPADVVAFPVTPVEDPGVVGVVGVDEIGSISPVLHEVSEPRQ